MKITFSLSILAIIVFTGLACLPVGMACLPVGMIGMALASSDHNTIGKVPCHEEHIKTDERLISLVGQIRLRGDFTRNQDLSDFSFTPGQNDE